MPPTPTPPELAALQRAVAGLVRAPEGVRAALAEAGDREGRGLGTWIRGDPRLGAVERLEIYAHAWFARLHEALGQDYEALAELVGPDGFHDLVKAYGIAHPSRHPSLRWAGAHLADYLEGDGAAEPFRARWPWAADLARLEWAISEAFDAADVALLTRADLAVRPAGAWADLALRLAPATRLVRVAWPVGEVRAQAAGARCAARPAAPRASVLCVWRRDEEVHFRGLHALEAELLARVGKGDSFGALCERAAGALGAGDAPGRMAALLAGWVDAGLLARPTL
jgi:hypothetical protein